MQKFRQHQGIVVPLDKADVDTDQIIPKQFLKRVERTGFGAFLFNDWRFDEAGKPRADFPLNQPRYVGASILVAGRNFGCGSSREHAVWALLDYGIRAVIAPSFADIFSSNCTKNGVALIVLPPAQVSELVARAGRFDGYRLMIDLEACTVRDEHGFSAAFSMDEFARKRLLGGLDDIALTLQFENEVTAFEAHQKAPRG